MIPALTARPAWGRFPDSPYALTLEASGEVATDPETLRVRDEAIGGLRAEIKRRLSLTSRIALLALAGQASFHTEYREKDSWSIACCSR